MHNTYKHCLQHTNIAYNICCTFSLLGLTMSITSVPTEEGASYMTISWHALGIHMYACIQESQDHQLTQIRLTRPSADTYNKSHDQQLAMKLKVTWPSADPLTDAVLLTSQHSVVALVGYIEINTDRRVMTLHRKRSKGKHYSWEDPSSDGPTLQDFQTSHWQNATNTPWYVCLHAVLGIGKVQFLTI